MKKILAQDVQIGQYFKEHSAEFWILAKKVLILKPSESFLEEKYSRVLITTLKQAPERNEHFFTLTDTVYVK